MNQYPDYTTYIKAVVLSANDVVATVLLLLEDEGYSPLNIASVSLPVTCRNYRVKSKDGKSRFQRGDLITIDCRVTEQHKKYFTEEDIDTFLETKIAFEDDSEAEVTQNIFDAQAQFAKDWAELEKRDLAKRRRNRD